jgi:hypothetical protein
VGDHLRTGPNTSAVIKYPDQSKLFLGRGTDVVLGETVDGAQWNDLTYGQVRGVITKPKGVEKTAAPRFLMRSRAAVMGVRGTDFVFKANETAVTSEVRTLEGEVQVAKDSKAMLEGKGVSVTPGTMVEADQDRLGDVRKFNREKYLKELEFREPELMNNVRDPDMGAAPPPLKSTAAASPAPVKAPKDYGKRFRLLKFEAGGIAVAPLTDRLVFNFSGQLSWNPAIRLLWDFLYIKLHAGFTMFRGDDGTFFPVVQLAAMPAFHFFNIFFIEPGVGFETWFSRAGQGPLIMGNVGFFLGKNKFFERIYAGASFFPQRGGSTISDRNLVTFRLGIGFQIP